MVRKSGLTLLIILAVVSLPAAAAARGQAPVAALQVALRAHGLYRGDVDGYAGPATRAGVRRFQARARLTVDGIAGPQTRRALGRLGRHSFGSRLLGTGRVGWDVSSLQFLLAWHGFPNGTVDGGFGAHVQAAVVRLQRWAGLVPDGVAGPATLAALRRPVPSVGVALRRPVPYAIGDGFGPRGNTLPTPAWISSRPTAPRCAPRVVAACPSPATTPAATATSSSSAAGTA